MNETLNAAQKLEESRDLLPQLGDIGLEDDERRFFILKETSPVRKKTRLWSMEDGSDYYFFNFRVPAMLEQRMPNGQPRWTSFKNKAPVFKVSQYPCFLAPESEIRSELDALGITIRCTSKHPSRFAMEQIARKKHPGSWAAWQAHLAEQERQDDRDRQDKQIAAMMQMAQGNVATQTQPVTISSISLESVAMAPLTCACGWSTPEGKQPKQSMAFHKRMHCPLREAK